LSENRGYPLKVSAEEKRKQSKGKRKEKRGIEGKT
jgi:hypothetical protein